MNLILNEELEEGQVIDLECHCNCNKATVLHTERLNITDKEGNHVGYIRIVVTYCNYCGIAEIHKEYDYYYNKDKNMIE